MAGTRTQRLRASGGVLTIVVASGVAGAFTSCAPTGSPVVDHLLTGLLAAATALAATVASPFALSIGALTVLVAGDSAAWRLVGIGLVVALGVLFSRDRLTPVTGAIVGGVVVQALLRLQWTSPVRGSAAAAAIGIVPILASGAWRASTGRPQLRRRVVVGVVIAGGLVAAGLAFVAVRTNDIVDRAQQYARAGVTAARKGDREEASTNFEAAAVEFRRAHDVVAAWWTRPGLALPVVAPQLRAIEDVAGMGADAVDTARAAIARVSPNRLRFVNGRIDLAEVARDQVVFANAERRTDAIHAALLDESKVWLVPPVDRAITRFTSIVQSAGDSTRTAADALALAPAFLGAHGERTYFVAFVTPVEARASGGLIGNYGILRARNGRIHLDVVGAIPDLNVGGRAVRRLTGLPEYRARYGAFDVANTWQNVTMSPDLPTVGRVISQLFPQSGGVPIDGVIEIGPRGMAGLLALSGPVQVPGLSMTLDENNVVPFLLHDQYRLFTEQQHQRYDLLGTIARVAFDKLTSGTSATPTDIARVMSPIVRRQQIAFWLRDAPAQRFVEHIGGDASVPPVDHADSFGVTDQNGNGSKIDYYLHRSIRYTADIDGRTGHVDAHVTVTLRNDSPAVNEPGMPTWVIGNPFGEKNGTNRSIVSLYSPLALKRMSVGGRAVAPPTQRELGRNVWTEFVDIGPGAEKTIELDLTGTVDLATGRYSFDFIPQTLANPDSVSVSIDVTHGRATEVATTGLPDGAAVQRGAGNVTVRVPASEGRWSFAATMRR